MTDPTDGGRAVVLGDVAAVLVEITAAALAVGFRSVVAVPLRLDGRAVGGLNLLYAERTVLPDWQLRVAQVAADLLVRIDETAEPVAGRAGCLSRAGTEWFPSHRGRDHQRDLSPHLLADGTRLPEHGAQLQSGSARPSACASTIATTRAASAS